MPRRDIPWLEIQRDWLAGETHAELAKKHNLPITSIQSRSRRHKWRDSTAEATRYAASKIRDVVRQSALDSLQSKVKARSERYIDRMTEDIVEKTEQMISEGNKYPEPTYDVMLMHEQVREKLVSSGRKMFGLDQEQGRQTVINIHALRELHIDSGAVLPEPSAVDVQSQVMPSEPEPGVSSDVS